MDYTKASYEVVEGIIDAVITDQPFPFGRGEKGSNWSVMRGKKRIGYKLTEVQARQMVRDIFKSETTARLAAIETRYAGREGLEEAPEELLDLREAVRLMSYDRDWLDGFELDKEILHGNYHPQK